MAPKLAVPPSAIGWQCPRCATRSFSSSARGSSVGPEHPRYIDIPQPPQQTIPYRPPMKGSLPIPRNVFSGSKRDTASDESIALSTRTPSRSKSPKVGSREEWKIKMSDIRRQNLREGIQSLKLRQDAEAKHKQKIARANQEARTEALNRPEREDERLTAPSINFDLERLLTGRIPDPTRDQRLKMKADNLERVNAAKREKRLDDLHTLYMNAREFILTTEQLDKHVDAVFGKDDAPVLFGGASDIPGNSVWAEGRPITIQEMLNQEVNKMSKHAVGLSDPRAKRMTRLAETLTGGKMDTQT